MFLYKHVTTGIELVICFQSLNDYIPKKTVLVQVYNIKQIAI